MDENQNDQRDDGTVDQDSEPTMTAPEEGRPDGLDTPKSQDADAADEDTDEFPISAEGTGDDLAGGLGRA